MDEQQRLAELAVVLAEARSLGFLGPGPVEGQISHAHRLADVIEREFDHFGPQSLRGGLVGTPGDNVVTIEVAELGAGGGVPGLVLACRWQATNWLLIEAHGRRAAFLVDAVSRLELGERVRVRHERAEVVGRDGLCRASFDLVVARSFGPPAVTAECAAPLLRAGGLLVVSEPPDADREQRWPAEGLSGLGLEPLDTERAEVAAALCRQALVCGDAFPRRTGIPTKRPLFLA